MGPMTINIAANSEAHLAVKDGVIRRSATYEVHLSGSSLQRLAALKHPEGVPGAIWDAITDYVHGGLCRENKGACLTLNQIRVLEREGLEP